MPARTKNTLTYRSAGVDIDQANRLVQAIAAVAKTTHRPGVVTGVGGFGALFEVPLDRYRRPILVSGTDGVGTKLKLAIDAARHDTIGIDLVAMCVNDILAHGAEPLFFLDYFATSKLDLPVATQIIDGIVRGCKLAGAALVGGETAEMPGLYAGNDYDLAGFCVGVVERDRLIDGSHSTPGDVLIGLASSGPHANGYSLIRRVLEFSGTDLNEPLGERSLADILLEPTRIYVRAVHSLMERLPVHAIAHITGGGLLENVPRVLPNRMRARINTTAWQKPLVFRWLQEQGRITDEELYRTFNCGIGMVLVVPEAALRDASTLLQELGEQAFAIGTLEASDETPPSVILE
ncbi:MAG: phosphoribosylformylglycinamidine cyclo-ligase [Gammaproteobacteria bacterium]